MNTLAGAGPCAVGFDFDHTLGLDNGLEATAYYRLGAELGRSISERDTTWSAYVGELLARFREGSIELEQAVGEFVERLGTPPAPHLTARYREICYSLVENLVTPIDGARELIATLARRSIPTAILTNGWSPLQQRKIARALGYSGPVLVSDELGLIKPDAAAFGKLVDVLKAPRDRIWFVGDNPQTDIAGAQGAGLRGVWFDWEHLAYPADAPEPDRRISALAELLDILPGRSVRAENVRR